MSTISTHLNWGSSYIVNDLWKRFAKPAASQRELVAVGRIATVVLMVMAASLALRLSSVLEGFQLLLKVGAGTGLIYILRWFWWRINALSEIVAMIVSFSLAAYFFFGKSDIPDWLQFGIIVAATTVCWMLAVVFGPAESDDRMRSFCARIRPGGPGWSRVLRKAHSEGQLLELDNHWNMPVQIVFLISGCLAIYGILFATGYFLYGQFTGGLIALAVALAGAVSIKLTWNSVASEKDK